MKDLHHSCQGESHIIANKICQDASYSSINDYMSIAIVCDGHGGARYFRSDVGAQYAIDATKSCVKAFVKEVDVNLFKNKPFIQKQAISTEAKASIPTKDTSTDQALRQLFSSIIYNWRKKIEQHVQNVPLSEEEKSKVDLNYQNDFENGIGVEKTYGCTLMCYVSTPVYWFAFQIGDGKCIAFQNDGNWNEPIPWDEKCFLNKTTSLCDSSAFEEFRYCYCGNGTFPIAVFLGSDGIDDSFGATENMVNFYIQILKLLVNEGKDSAVKNIVETLPHLSLIGSKDDMSIACIYDDVSLSSNIKNLINWQINNIGNDISKVNERILKQKNIISNLNSQDLNSQNNMIEYQYAQKELSRAFENKKKLVEKWNHFAKELFGDEYSPFKDEIGFDLIENVNDANNNIN